QQAHAENIGVGMALWGEAGVGKSHLLHRLRRWARRRHFPFVYLYNLQASPERLPRYVLHCVVSGLTRGQTQHLGRTPLFALANGVCVQAIRRYALGKPSWPMLEAAYRALVGEWGVGPFERTVYDVLFRFFRSAYPKAVDRNDRTALLAA